VGTCSLHDENELSVLEYREDCNQIDAVAVYTHTDQIWAIAASPSDPSLTITSRQASDGSRGVTLWRMPNQTLADLEESEDGAPSSSFGGTREALQEIASFNTPDVSSFTQSIAWHNSNNNVLLTSNTTLSTWTVTESRVEQTGKMLFGQDDLFGDKGSQWASGVSAWDPHAAGNCATGYGDALHLVDARKMEVTSRLAGAHKGTIRDIDYNPNKPLMLISAGDDRKVKFWDLRNLSGPVKTLAGHSHWTWCARYNPFHDQLLIR
jgi:EARP and GARP complex-interacting protein 1